MQIKNEYPPAEIWDRVKACVHVEEGAEILFTYGDTVYNPTGIPIDQFLEHHEAQHVAQQAAMGKDEWWDRWLKEPAFRAEQEAQAYAAQYSLYCKYRADRNVRAKYLHAISNHLASGLYGLTMNQNDARAAILKRA
jgi:hypothetical protein